MEPEPSITSQSTILPSPCTSDVANRALQTRMAIWGTVSIEPSLIDLLFPDK